MLRKYNINILLDSRNRDLWNELSEYFDIKIKKFKKPYSALFAKKDKVKIYINPKTITIGAFTHELLHLWFRKKRIYIGSSIGLWAKGKPTIKKIFSNDLLMHIGNTVEHIKMFPKFIDLGFESNDFLYDNDVPKCMEKDLRKLKKNYKLIHGYNSKAIDLYIGIFFAICADHNDKLNYDYCHSELITVDPSLYQLLYQFWKEWTDFDIEEDSIDNSHHEVTCNFTNHFEEWIWGKSIY